MADDSNQKDDIKNIQLEQRLAQIEQMLLELRANVVEEAASEPEQKSVPNAKGTVSKVDNDRPREAKKANAGDKSEPLNRADSSEEKDDSPNNEDEESNGPPIGEIGVFDGEFVLMPNDKKYQVPPNYISKSMLVEGDKLRLTSHGDQNEFQVVEQIDREELTGILTKKDFLWTVMVGEFSFKVVSAAIRYHGGDIGDKVTVFVPKGYKDLVPTWAAVKSIEKGAASEGGFAGSKSAQDIIKDKKMRYVERTNAEKTDETPPQKEKSKDVSKSSRGEEARKAADLTGRKGEIDITKTSQRGEVNIVNNSTKVGPSEPEDKPQTLASSESEPAAMADFDGVPPLR
ncbi:hypothetical protein KC614_02695 [candidate division WWE3 bacterium]|uniref:50S ribosomal protein L7/L12 n=1 Tax=candidate division WWE3 bacterium TaxID=2053526 RepID=A0A955LKJ3_UNCKA|nr:hypothetical protein [candidate division WWE3 bacterium]